MIIYELLCMVLAFSTSCITSEATVLDNINNDRGKPPDKITLGTSQSYIPKVQQSSASKIIGSIFPINKTPKKRHDAIDYFQHTSGISSPNHIENDCNACNREPWVPIIPHINQKAAISYISSTKHIDSESTQYNDLKVLETLHPPPISYKVPVMQYSSPLLGFKSNTLDYILPTKAQNNFQTYDTPIYNKEYMLLADYMTPPPVNYRIPSLVYKPSKPLYNLPHVKTKPTFRPHFLQSIYGQIKGSYNPGQQYSEQMPPLTFVRTPAGHSILPYHFETTDLKPVSQNHEPSYPSAPDLPHFINTITEKNVADIPSDSYGAPVTGDSLTYLSSPEQLSLPNENKEYIERPVPLPHLSSFPVLPFPNIRNFNKMNNEQIDNDVKVQQSIRIADYLAAIEHPINVIQSPLIDLSIQDDSFTDSGNQDNKNVESVFGNSTNIYFKEFNNSPFKTINPYPYISSHTHENQIIDNEKEKPEKLFNNIKEKLEKSEDTATKLSENPIIVEDAHVAASTNNNTFVDSDYLQTKLNKISDLENEQSNMKYDIKTRLRSNFIFSGSDITRKDVPYQNFTSHTSNIHTNNEYVTLNNITIPPMDYSNWIPTYGVSNISPTSFKPPIVKDSLTTKKPKILQIIVPYISSKTSESLNKEWMDDNKQQYNNIYKTLVPVPPSTTEISVWSKFVESLESQPVLTTVVPKTSTSLYNINDLFNKKKVQRQSDLPYDVILLQKHIDNWTQEAYSQSTQHKKETVLTSKNIPSNFLTTQEPKTHVEATMKTRDYNFDVFTKMRKNEDDVNSNLITQVESSRKDNIPSIGNSVKKSVSKELWNTSHVTLSPRTKEKIYVVTPQNYNYFMSTPATAWSAAPKIENGKINNGSTYNPYKFSIRVEPQNITSRDKLKRESKSAIKIVYSEWPHLINSLQATTVKPTSKHPLFGLMDVSTYTISPSPIDTTSSYSHVSTTGSSPSVSDELQSTTTNMEESILST